MWVGCQRTAERSVAWIEGLTKLQVILLIVAYSATVSVGDHIAGDEIPLSILHLPAVALACWSVSLRVAVVLSFVCSMLWLVDDLIYIETHGGPHTHECIMAFAHAVCFTVVSAVLARLQVALDRERMFGLTDYLTGIANSKAFFETATTALAEARRQGMPLTVAFLDCDHFKAVNDTLGHAVGDELLRNVAQTMQQNLRPRDTVARMGGDEFAFLLPATDRDDAEHIISRVRRALEEQMKAKAWPVGFSIGVVTFADPPDCVATLLKNADELMYSLKVGEKGGAAYRLVS